MLSCCNDCLLLHLIGSLLLFLLIVLDRKLTEAGCGSDLVYSGRATMSMDSSVERLIIMEFIGLSSGTGELGTTALDDSILDCLDILSFLLCDVADSVLELSEGESSLSLGLGFGKYYVYIGSGEGLAHEAGVLGHLGEDLAFHGLFFTVEYVEY